MANPLLQRALQEPGYGWTRNGELYKPSTREIMREWLTRMNIFRSRKAWLAVMVWGWTLMLFPFGIVFLTRYFSWPLMFVGFLYSMVWIGTHGTVYLHRFGTHHAFTFRNGFYRFIVRNLSIKIVPEEVYIISHHVHHTYSDLPGDPYNARAGWLYCFLAGELHQQINQNLSEKDYGLLSRLLKHTGMKLNTYEQYKKWGSVTDPARLMAHYALNWAFWYAAFWLIGGHALATALFGWAAVWAIGIRAHNYDLHAGGKDKHQEGVDFDRSNLSINQFWPGMVAGEWHNNHHLFPSSVRSGFLWWQFDISFAFIWFYRMIGGVTQWRDFKEKFYERHYRPYLAAKRAGQTTPSVASQGSEASSELLHSESMSTEAVDTTAE